MAGIVIPVIVVGLLGAFGLIAWYRRRSGRVWPEFRGKKPSKIVAPIAALKKHIVRPSTIVRPPGDREAKEAKEAGAKAEAKAEAEAKAGAKAEAKVELAPVEQGIPQTQQLPNKLQGVLRVMDMYYGAADGKQYYNTFWLKTGQGSDENKFHGKHLRMVLRGDRVKGLEVGLSAISKANLECWHVKGQEYAPRAREHLDTFIETLRHDPALRQLHDCAVEDWYKTCADKREEIAYW